MDSAQDVQLVQEVVTETSGPTLEMVYAIEPVKDEVRLYGYYDGELSCVLVRGGCRYARVTGRKALALATEMVTRLDSQATILDGGSLRDAIGDLAGILLGA